MAKSKHYYIRKSHRYLGVIIGIWFLLWTIGRLYLSWTNIDEIHGAFQHRQPAHLSGNIQLASPESILQQLPKFDSIQSSVARILKRYGIERLQKEAARRALHSKRYNRLVTGHHLFKLIWITNRITYVK